MERRDENPCARTSRVAAEDNRELNCFWSGNSVCSLQYVAGKGAPLFIESNAKFACTVEREPPPSQLSTISPEEHAKTTPFLRMRFCLCITVISRRFFSIARNLDLADHVPKLAFRFIGRLSTGLAPVTLIPFQQTGK